MSPIVQSGCDRISVCCDSDGGDIVCRAMTEAQTKQGCLVPESVLKKQKRNEEWALKKKEGLAALKTKNAENRKLIFNRAKQYSKEYDEQVTVFILHIF